MTKTKMFKKIHQRQVSGILQDLIVCKEIWGKETPTVRFRTTIDGKKQTLHGNISHGNDDFVFTAENGVGYSFTKNDVKEIRLNSFFGAVTIYASHYRVLSTLDMEWTNQGKDYI